METDSILAALDRHAGTLTATTRAVQWEGCTVWKIGGKVYGIFAPKTDRLTVKCADEETADFLIEIEAARRAPHLPRGGWIALDLARTPTEELCDRLSTSYQTVHAGLPKRIAASL